MIFKQILLITLLNEPGLLFILHMVKWFHEFLFNMNNSKYYQAFFCTQINRFNDCYIIVTIKHPSFVYTRLNDRAVQFLMVQFSMSFVWIQFKCQTVLFHP